MPISNRVSLLAAALTVAAMHPASPAPWIAADWAGDEPQFEPGSLYWKTNQYPICPVLYRTVVDVGPEPTDYAGFVARGANHLYVFLNGRQIAAAVASEGADTTGRLDVELTQLLEAGPNVLTISTGAAGFALSGGISHDGNDFQPLATDTERWQVNKLPPLTMLEYADCMNPDFSADDWFGVTESEREGMEISTQELADLCRRLADTRLSRWDDDARWRLRMLAEKGIAIVNWRAHGWAGPHRHPNWLLAAAREALAATDLEPGAIHQRAEALTRYAKLSDEATNLHNHVTGLKALDAPATAIAACQRASQQMQEDLNATHQSIQAGEFTEALQAADRAADASAAARHKRILNDLNCAVDNKFSWFDDPRVSDSDIANWGLEIASPASVLSSPLSRAALITLPDTEFILEGWGDREPRSVREEPPRLGPEALWACIDGEVKRLEPNENGDVYNLTEHGPLTENWILLVENLNRGGRLPIQLVFLRQPRRISFQLQDDTTTSVRVAFDEPGARLFALRPLQDYSGNLTLARTLANPPDSPKTRQSTRAYIDACRLWSRAVLRYPVTYSEAFAPAPDDRWALRVADVYNYRQFEDAWGTEPLQLAPLPPLATYGLMTSYPGLEVISDVENIGSRDIWGDEIAAVGTDHIVYRVPLDPIKRFGGFTSFCFSPVDIGVPGNVKEIETIVRTGANSFRPQHNRADDAAINTAQLCWQNGLQNVFNIDEKWIIDAQEHYRTLARTCVEYPPDAIAYDLVNEPDGMSPQAHNAFLKKITRAIREIDKRHLIYAEVLAWWVPASKPYPKAALGNLDPTGDRLTCYSFHDYTYRLPPRWPNAESDVRDILDRWVPAFRYSIANRAPMHIGEFGGFEQTDQDIYENRCAATMIMDYLRIFDQFGWHWHYYANRGVVRLRADGSLQESYVQDGYRRYFAQGTFNMHREDWSPPQDTDPTTPIVD